MDAQVNELELTCTEDDEPLIRKQRYLVQKAMNRGQLSRKIRCLIGKHNPPHDQPINDGGLVMIGGPCTECDDSEERPIVIIGFEHDFDGLVRRTRRDGRFDYKAYFASVEAQIQARIQFLHS